MLLGLFLPSFFDTTRPFTVSLMGHQVFFLSSKRFTKVYEGIYAVIQNIKWVLARQVSRPKKRGSKNRFEKGQKNKTEKRNSVGMNPYLEQKKKLDIFLFFLSSLKKKEANRRGKTTPWPARGLHGSERRFQPSQPGKAHENPVKPSKTSKKTSKKPIQTYSNLLKPTQTHINPLKPTNTH